MHTSLHCVPAPVLPPITLHLLLLHVVSVCASRFETCLAGCEGHRGAMKAAHNCCSCLQAPAAGKAVTALGCLLNPVFL